MRECELCDLERKTRWYYESEAFVVCDCLTCNVPMIVLRQHGLPMGLVYLERRAFEICRNLFGDDFIDFRTTQQKVKEHWHWHVVLREGGKYDRS